MSKQSSTNDSSIINLLNTLVRSIGSASESSDDISLLGSSLSAAKEFFERQALGGLALISPHEHLDDIIALKGEVFELSVSVGRAQSFAGMRAHFDINGEHISDIEIGPEGKARTTYQLNQAGCFPLAFSLHSKRGANIHDSRKQNGLLVQVLGEKPVICVDASVFLHKKSIVDTQLIELSKQGFDLVYLDFGHKIQVDDIRKVRHQRSLPEGAIISLSARIQEFESFDVDFKQSFLGIAIARLRARGVPVVSVVSDFNINRDHVFPNVEIFSSKQVITSKQINVLKRKTKAFLQKRQQALQEKTNNMDWRIHELVAGNWQNGNACTIELNNKSARQAIFKAINSAQHGIDLQFYIFKESRFTHELGLHLAKAAQRGVQVRLMVDALWSGENFLGSWNSFLKRMGKNKRIHIIGADAVTLSDEWDALALRQRDHRKLILIDGIQAFVGGRNAADEYYYDWSEIPITDWTLADNIPWLDAHVQITGALVNDIQKLFDRTWKRNAGQANSVANKSINVSGGQKQNKTQTSKNNRAMLVVHEGTSDANGLAAYEALISGAQKKLILVNDFPVLDDIAEMLIQAVHRGVDVSFLTGNVLARRADGSFFEGGRHRELFEYVIKSRLGVLVDAGVNVYEFQTAKLDNIASTGSKLRPYVHAKLITADGRYASIGSANLDVTASYWEREANILIDDVKVVSALDRKLKTMLNNGIRINTNSEEWKRETAQREIVARLWPDSIFT